MKKKITSLALVLALCLSLLPLTAFAEEGESEVATVPEKRVITSVDDLMKFAEAVNEGIYTNQTEAVVSLEADLDLKDVKTWTPIGSVFASDGTLQHYFSGKFYGNGHTISNLNFSENYGKSDYPSFGFFSEIYGAEVSSLTIQGNLDVSNSGYVYFGTVAGVAADSKISDCVSDVSFTDTDKYINGTVALCGYAINSTIEYCQNKGDFSVTKDVTSFQMGGIVGLAQNSTVQYCTNTGDMTSWTPCTGGVIGQLYQDSKIINCYSTGKMVPLGRGNTDFGGIAGIVGAGTEIRHCYFAGEIDLSGYTATITPPATAYSRLGGIAGQVSSGTPTFTNNYFRETEKVADCVKGAGDATAGTAKTADYMKTEGFYNELKAGDGDYIYVEGSTPILPAPKYTVSFDIKPTDLTGVTVKIGEETLDLNTKKIALAAGAYNVTVGATFSKEIKITANHATHTQQLNLTANYTAVDAAIEKAKALNESDYRNFDTVKAAIAAVVRDKNIAQQAEVDAMGQAIEDAITGLVRKSSGSSRPRYDVTTPSKPENGSVTVDPERARSGSRVTVTVTPDSGYKLGELVVTDKDGKKLELTDKGNGQYTFTMPSGKVEVAAEFVKEVEISPFADVATDAYYYDAVKWAVNKGVTNGVSETLFGPDQACTRAQIVTFLWRAAGSPEAKRGSSFADVAADAYYAKAVAWAVENGITKGTSETTFHPDEICTRAQGVTFLYRALGKLAAAQAGFTDVAADSYYADAVNWAAENGVTKGISETLFGPDGSCTRAQIVTFLYRAYQGK